MTKKILLPVLDICSGIGGFALAASLANHKIGFDVFQTVQFVELNSFCQKVLSTRFPGISIHDDFRTFTAQPGRFAIIAGGLPCQPFSQAGKQKGKEDDRDLFEDFFRVLRDVQPIGCVLENVPGLLTNDSGRRFRDILWQFSQAGYDVQWGTVSCAEVGGTHLRERLWIVAYSNRISKPQSRPEAQPSRIGGKAWMEFERQNSSDGNGASANTDSIGHKKPQAWKPASDTKRNDQTHQQRWAAKLHEAFSSCAATSHTDSKRLETRQRKSSATRSFGEFERSRCTHNRKDEVESIICSGDDGFSNRVDTSNAYLLGVHDLPEALQYATDSYSVCDRTEQLQALGNAISPQVGAIAFLKLWEALEGILKRFEVAA